MKITDQGQFSVQAQTERVIQLMTDPDFLGRTLPDSKGYRVTSPTSVVADMKVGVSHIKGVMPTTLTIQPVHTGEPVTIRVVAQGLGSRVDMELAFNINGVNGSTELDWSSTATVSGVLASVGSGLLRPMAKRNFDAIVGAIRDAIEAAS